VTARTGLRVIAGSLKGRRLETPAWEGLRPTSDRLRETLFNILSPRISGAHVLDAFAGTGAVGIEALSRGARQVTFAERDRRAIDLITANVAHCGVAEGCAIIRVDLGRGPLPFDTVFDLIFLDPPTFSNSKRMSREFDVQRDHADLIRAAMERLAPGGLLLFSTNFRKFRLDRAALAGFDIRDITKGTVPFDFARDAKVHACFEVRRR